MRYFKYVTFKPTRLPEVLSIDEFKGNSGGRKYNSIVVDAEKHKVMDILPAIWREGTGIFLRGDWQFQRKMKIGLALFEIKCYTALDSEEGE